MNHSVQVFLILLPFFFDSTSVNNIAFTRIALQDVFYFVFELYCGDSFFSAYELNLFISLQVVCRLALILILMVATTGR